MCIHQLYITQRNHPEVSYGRIHLAILKTDPIWDLSPLRVTLLILHKLFHLSFLNIQNFLTEVSISFVQRKAPITTAARSACIVQNNEVEFFSSFPLTSEQVFLGVTHLFTMVIVTTSLVPGFTY